MKYNETSVRDCNLFIKRINALNKAMKKARNVEFKQLWFDKLKQLIINEREKLVGERGNGTIH